MKKLKLKNLKVVKLTKDEKKIVKGGNCTTVSSEPPSGPYISWCNGCGEEDH
ncbi:hypothetical protein [uncultured Flavobacterium sp.]|jgi:hypothetical protein|uniref:hypothetical protein n=1 Tax=uncultured Flavobacterium sp. TaxID=165435 RepID=UPI00308134ED